MTVGSVRDQWLTRDLPLLLAVARSEEEGTLHEAGWQQHLPSELRGPEGKEIRTRSLVRLMESGFLAGTPLRGGGRVQSVLPHRLDRARAPRDRHLAVRDADRGAPATFPTASIPTAARESRTRAQARRLLLASLLRSGRDRS